jgi:Domain of unknown function (DUF6089)
MNFKPYAAALAALVISIASTPAQAQYYYYNDNYYDNPLVFEVGASIGLMNSLTDLGGKKGLGKNTTKDINWKNTKFSGSISLTAMYMDAVGLRLEGTFGQVQGYDSILKSVAKSTNGRYERNLSFRSNISEFSAVIECHPLNWRKFDYDRSPSRISPYFFVGIGLFSFNPQAKLNGAWVDLQPLRTEGQGFKEYPDRKPYKLNQMNIPYGLGVRYELSQLFVARFEIVNRKLFTDYLDDVSSLYIDPAHFYTNLNANQAALAQQLADRQGELNPAHVTSPGDIRGDSKDNDSYFSFQFKIGMILGRQRVKR